jgi:hypothetical protein
VHRVALIVRERAQRPVDRQLVKIRPPSRLSCVSVYENSRPAAAVVGEVDARHHMAGMKRDLFGFGEEVVRVAVQRHAADRLHRHELLGHQLGRVEQVEVEFARVGRVDQLHAQFEFG